MPHSGTFFEITAILTLATVLGIAGQKLRQPLIIMFLATGILAGPSALAIIQNYDQIALLAQIGISLLLFIVGLKLDLNLIRTTGPVALATGAGQIIFTAAIGFVMAWGLDMAPISALYVAVALTFSSTIIVVKLLSDKKEIDSLHGQIAVGLLIVQDIAAILALVVLTTIGSQAAAQTSTGWTTAAILVKGGGLLVVVALLMRYGLPWLIRRLAASQEMLTLFAIAWAIFLGASSEWLGFTKEVGAFLAGVSLASTAYRDALGARLTSLRDFLLLFFFIDLGARLNWSTVGSQVQAAIALSLFVMMGKPLIVLAIMGAMGYRRRTGFMAGLTVAQISEFSLIVAALGLTIGHITDQDMGLITLVGVVTIFASSYMILYAEPLYRFLSTPLMLFERRNPYRETAIAPFSTIAPVDVILVGLGNYGSGIADYLLRRNKNIIGVDFDPVALERWRARGLFVLYGDMADPEIHEHLPLKRVRWVVSTVRSKELNIAMLQQLKNREYSGKVALTAANQEEAVLFEQSGAQVVFRPFTDAAEQAADALTQAMDVLPANVNWPIAFREVRIQSGAAFAGQTIREIPLRSITGVSILAVSRAGRVHFDPGPDFRIYPGDRLVIMGPPEELRQAEELLKQTQENDDTHATDHFVVAEIPLANPSTMVGQNLADLKFRQKHGVTVVGIRRGERQITSPGPGERLAPNDHLIVIGGAKKIEALKQNAPLG
jgi:Kef-type K+ transport system membrane component KefB/Trk K+ transport system NAD-binding subunit